jgi:hypothetical protein
MMLMSLKRALAKWLTEGDGDPRQPATPTRTYRERVLSRREPGTRYSDPPPPPTDAPRSRRGGFVLAGALALAVAAPAPAYFPPGDDVIDEPGTHGRICLRAIELLERSKSPRERRVGSFFARYRRAFLRGVRDADRGGGILKQEQFLSAIQQRVPLEDLRAGAQELAEKIEGYKIPRNAFTHFYNPETGEGFRMSMGRRGGVDLGPVHLSGDVDAIVDLVDEYGGGQIPWQVSTLFGVQTGADVMADWYYARAVDAIRSAPTDMTWETFGDEAGASRHVARAVQWLGYSVHMVQDATVPHHASDDGSQDEASTHLSYESLVNQRLADDAKVGGALMTHAETPFALDGESEGASPGALVRRAAHLATEDDRKEKVDKLEANLHDVAEDLVALAEAMTARLMIRFYDSWRSEHFAVVALKIDRVTGLRTSDPNGLDDYLAWVNIAGSERITSEITNGSDIDPQQVLPHYWFFPQWVRYDPSRPSDMNYKRVRWDLFEQDAPGDVERVDTNPWDGHHYTEVLNYVDPATGHVYDRIGAQQVASSGKSITLRGDAEQGPSAKVSYSITTFPRPVSAIPPPPASLASAEESPEPIAPGAEAGMYGLGE